MFAAARIDRGPLGLHDFRKRVVVESASRMYRDRRGFVDHEETVGVMQNSDGCGSDGRFVTMHNVRDHVADGCERGQGLCIIHVPFESDARGVTQQ